MNKIFTLLLTVSLAMACGTAWAETISDSQARSIAENFMASHKMSPTNLKLVKKQAKFNAPSTSNKAAYYVFNSERSGYVIVAGDDRAPAVLGYSDKGTFDATDIPEAMEYLLEGYSAQIEALNQGAMAAPQLTTGPAINPLLTSTWSQKGPYNQLLPMISGTRAVAGCVATALAQVLYYWKWPVRPTTTIPEYTTSSLGIYMPALTPVTFNWEAMQDCYLSSDTLSTEGLAAATLTKYCAQAVEMDFKEGTSGATTTRSPWVLATYFGYKASVHTLYRNNHTTQEWADIIYNELAAGRPIIYSASKKNSGHAFICDGYDGEGRFHINWGWNGRSNGYFLLNVLNPELQGTGSASGVYGYVFTQAIIVGIEPGQGESEFAMTATDVALNSASTTRTGTNYDFRAILTGRFRNYTSQVIAARFGWGLFDVNNNFIECLYDTYTTGVRPGFYFTLTEKTVSFGAGRTSGTYRIMPIYSEYGKDNWRPCIGSDKNYIEVTINGNQCSFKGYGSAAERNYTINDITMSGTMHNGRPIDINVNITNNGDSHNNLLYLFANNTFIAASYVSISKGETADIPFAFMPSAAGNYTLTWSWNDDGSSPIATRTVTINPMPTASISGTLTVLNVTDATNKIVTSDKFSVELTVTNNGNQTYNEDLSFKLYKHTYGNSGTSVQGINVPIVLAAGETKTVQVDFDNVMNGWKYFVNAYYYSAGEQIKIKGTVFHTIIFPEVPEVLPGDVNDDKVRNIQDVTVLINYLLNGDTEGVNLANADVDGSTIINIQDVTSLISILLNGTF